MYKYWKGKGQQNKGSGLACSGDTWYSASTVQCTCIRVSHLGLGEQPCDAQLLSISGQLLVFHIADCNGDTLTHSLVQYTPLMTRSTPFLCVHMEIWKGKLHSNNAQYTTEHSSRFNTQVYEALSSSGGLALASSAGALPQNCQQVSNLRHCTNESHEPLTEKQKDPLLLWACARKVKARTLQSTLYELLLELKNQWLYCASTEWPGAILHWRATQTVDPTFNLGDFDASHDLHLMLTNIWKSPCNDGSSFHSSVQKI